MGAEKGDIKDTLTRTNFGMTSAQGAGGVVSTHYHLSAGQSMEQLYNPIQILRQRTSGAPTPGFQDTIAGGLEDGTFGGGNFVGPSIVELDPYFTPVLDYTHYPPPSEEGDGGEGGEGGESTPTGQAVLPDSDGEPVKYENEFFANCDYKLIVNENSDGFTTDLNINKLDDKRGVAKVRVNAHRAPLILSGWGFDLGDRPVPRLGASFPDIYKFDPKVAHDRTKWKTGPLAVAWDDERQVWAGGPQIVCGIVIKEGPNEGNIVAPANPCDPTYFVVQLFRKTTDQFSSETDATPDAEDPVDEWDPDSERITTMLDNYSVKNKKTDQTTEFNDRIKVANRDPSLEQAYVENAMFVIAIRLNYEWLPLWVGCPEDDIPEEDVPCIIQPKEKEEPDGGDPPTDQEPQVDPPL